MPGRQVHSASILLILGHVVSAQVDLQGASEKWDHDGSCEWPHCLPKCESCTGKKIDSCWLSYAGMGTCESNHPNSTCFIGRCICEVGFCAKEVADGKYECQPPVCEVGGPKPPPVEKSIYQNIFLMFTAMDDFPDPEIFLPDIFPGYVMTIIVLPVLLLVAGFIACVGLSYCLCCGLNGHHFVYGHTADDEDEDEDEDSREPLQKKTSKKKADRPNGYCLAILMVLIVVLTIFVVARRTVIIRDTFDILRRLFGRTVDDADVLATQAVHLNATCQNFLHQVHTLVRDCSDALIVGPLVKGFEGKIDDDLDTYRDMLANYSAMAVQTPTRLQNLGDEILSHESLLVWLPNIPAVFLAIVCLSIITEVLVTMCVGTSACAKCVDHCLRLATVGFVLTLTAVTLAVMVTSTVGTGLSQYCEDPDHNTRNFVAYFSNSSDVDNAAQHYMEGEVVNPIHTMGNVAKKYIVNVDDTYKDIKPAIEGFAGICNNRDGVNVTKLAVEVVQVLGRAEQLLSGKHLWPFYVDVVRKTICFETVSSLGVTTVFLTIMGLVFFPIVACRAHLFLVRWSKYEKSINSEDDGDDPMEDPELDAENTDS